MRLIDADKLLDVKKMHLYYHLPNGDVAIPIIDIEHAQTVGGWISVRERMPEELSECLGYGRGEYALIHVGLNGWLPAFVTHWMPLPSTEGLHDA